MAEKKITDWRGPGQKTKEECARNLRNRTLVQKLIKPECPNCRKQMRLVSTGGLYRTFWCETCKKTEIKPREEIKPCEPS